VLELVEELFGESILALVVRRRVRVRTGHGCVDESRPLSGAHPVHRFGALAPDLEVVAAVDLRDVEPAETPDHLGDGGRRLVGGAHRDRIAVVGHDEQHR
jgi:hypothetical protein